MQLHPRLLPRSAGPLYQVIREDKPVLIVFEINDKLAGLCLGRVEGDTIIVPFNEDETVTFRFNKNTNDPEQQDHNLKMLAWREYAGAWHVLDARASTILPTLDTYVEGDVS